MQRMTPAPSLWRETATPAPPLKALSGSVTADVAIVGAGYTGLSAALRAIEAGLKPVIIEAEEVGFGASGRNGGVVSTKYRVSLSDMARHHGVETAKRMSRLGHDAMDCVERYVEELGIQQAGLAKTGNLRCAHNAQALAALTGEARTVRETFGDQSLRLLDRAETAFETGSQDFAGGVLNSHAGVIHPLNYARGLARAVVAGGGEIFERSLVEQAKQAPAGIELTTSRGSVRAERLIVATNGYSNLSSATSMVRQAVIPFRSAMIATQPLPPETFNSLVPHARGYSETRRMMRWFRRIDDRLLFGGRGAFGKTDSASAFTALETAMKGIFPKLADVPITHRWSGLVAMTMDSLPQIGLANPRTAFSFGYNGTGVAMASLLGRHALELVIGEKPDLGLMRRDRPEAIPFYFLREPAVRTVVGWYQFLDKIGR
ncbi:NAD(P)/FAD-dependent oxidoreductase [Prosthecodimorpha staleyi]|uniref:FAD-binding oxidoreductase n=1 Tax=Prosthecodimorpha staleyi TaxID=2840188 RepID=A0A947GE04_9HYPH|nr:FAD-dependent oxidoreductase [Prosthecodimorpha staleyi]MBT9293163.1 FAD-binding oxidoreductase [Prosthecodimorpha staleyi]